MRTGKILRTAIRELDADRIGRPAGIVLRLVADAGADRFDAVDGDRVVHGHVGLGLSRPDKSCDAAHDDGGHGPVYESHVQLPWMNRPASNAAGTLWQRCGIRFVPERFFRAASDAEPLHRLRMPRARENRAS